MEWQRCRWTRQLYRRATNNPNPLPGLILQLFFGEERGCFLGEPIEEVARLPESAGIRLRAEHHDGNLIVALRQPEECREAIAGLADETGLAPYHIHSFHDETVRAVDADSAAVRLDGVSGCLHDRSDALIRGCKRDQARQVVCG